MSRVGISAAALGACAGLLTLVALVGGPPRSTAAPAPLVQVTAKELRLSQPLAAMDAEGKGVAFAFCNQLLGGLVRQFPGLAGLTRGAELMGNDRLVVLVPGKVREYRIPNGTLVRTRPVPHVASGGVCGMPPCPAIKLQLLDAKRGLVAYILNGKLHLLRLRDGVDKIVANATDARFGGDGLYYAYTAAAPWVARIRFVRWSALPVPP